MYAEAAVLKLLQVPSRTGISMIRRLTTPQPWTESRSEDTLEDGVIHLLQPPTVDLDLRLIFTFVTIQAFSLCKQTEGEEKERILYLYTEEEESVEMLGIIV